MPFDHDQIDNLDAAIDGLDSPSTLELYEATDQYEPAMVAASAAQRALAGGGGGGGSQPGQLFARLSIQGGADSGADVAAPIVGTFFIGDENDQMAFTGPSTFAASHHSRCWVSPPNELPDGAILTLSYVEFMVSNAAGTEKLRFEYDGDPITLTPVPDNGPRYSFPFADCSVTEQIGDDLTLVSIDDASLIPDTGVAAIQSAAGGQFFQEMLVQFAYAPPS